jgi:hypothetical protein
MAAPPSPSPQASKALATTTATLTPATTTTATPTPTPTPTPTRTHTGPRQRRLLPALRRPPPPPDHKGTCLYDLPAELRIEIYKLALESVQIHILPPNSSERNNPHGLVLTSRQVRNEVLPLIHNSCAIRIDITDFNFDGLLAFMSRMPPDQEANLRKNTKLEIRLCTTTTPNGKKGEACNSMRNSASLRKWLHVRADKYRPQPNWVYSGPVPDYKTAYEMRRRAKRTRIAGERMELVRMLKAIGVDVPGVSDVSETDDSPSARTPEATGGASQ